MSLGRAMRWLGAGCAWSTLCAAAAAQQNSPTPSAPQSVAPQINPQTTYSAGGSPQAAYPSSIDLGPTPSVVAQPPAPMAPVPVAPGGACTLALSADRTTLRLLNPATLQERKHLSLGRDRVQQVYTATDGAWSVAVFKVRDADDYGFIAIDLAACDDQQPVDLPALATAAAFEADAVNFVFASGAQRYALRRPRTQ